MLSARSPTHAYTAEHCSAFEGDTSIPAFVGIPYTCESSAESASAVTLPDLFCLFFLLISLTSYTVKRPRVSYTLVSSSA